MNYILIISSVLLNCLAQIFMRKGMLGVGQVGLSGLFSSAVEMFFNLWLWGAMACYGISILLWMVVLSKVQVSFAYPFLSIGYLVAAAIGYFWLGENLDLYKIAGIFIICLGICVLSRSSI